MEINRDIANVHDYKESTFILKSIEIFSSVSPFMRITLNSSSWSAFILVSRNYKCTECADEARYHHNHSVQSKLSESQNTFTLLSLWRESAHARFPTIILLYLCHKNDINSYYLPLFMSYCGSLYSSSIWCKYTKKQYYQMEVAYNNVFRRFFGYYRFSSASQVLNYDKSGKNFYICSHELTPNFIDPCDVSAKCYFIYNRTLLIFSLNAVSNCTLHASLVYFPHVLFFFFFSTLHYHCIHYVFKYWILCISLHVLWKPAIKIYHYCYYYYYYYYYYYHYYYYRKWDRYCPIPRIL